MKLRREKRIRKTKVTKLKHYLQKLCSVYKGSDDQSEIENCINELWDVLEETQLTLDELSGVYLELNDVNTQKGIMEESDKLQQDIQEAIDSAQKILIALPSLSEQSKPSVKSASFPVVFQLSQVTFHNRRRIRMVKPWRHKIVTTLQPN
jgi:hypothetical protein